MAVLKWRDAPGEAPGSGVRTVAVGGPGGLGGAGGLGGPGGPAPGRIRRMWAAWLREWSVFAPRSSGTGDWELV